MRKNLLVFGSPAIEDDEIADVNTVMQSGWLGTGPKVAQFEQEFAHYKDIEYAIALNSCTAALHLSCLAADIGAGDEVITTPLTFCATINAIIHAGATPILADIDPITMNIDPDKVHARITRKTKAILPVHFAGRPCDMDTLCLIAKDHKLKIIEDCAHAIETTYKGRNAGTFGDFGCFSFYVTKNIVTGDGGMVLTRSEKDAVRIKTLALHGMSIDAWNRFEEKKFKHYKVLECGYKYNMMDLQAALGIHQLKRVEANWKRRKEIWQKYNDAFKNLPITLPALPEQDTKHAYHLYTIQINAKKTAISRDNFLHAMLAQNIGVGVHYLSIPEHPFYKKEFGWKPEDYPNAMKTGRRTVSLPLSAKLTDVDVMDVIKTVRTILT